MMGQSKHILVIDDNADVRDVIVDTLQVHNYRVSAAADGSVMRQTRAAPRVLAGAEATVLTFWLNAVLDTVLEEFGMPVTTATTHEPAAKSASAATRDGARALSGHSADAQGTASEAGYSTLQTMSRMIYTCSYALAYGVVYATVFIAQSLPQENPVMNGFRDGRQAAMDELGAG